MVSSNYLFTYKKYDYVLYSCIKNIQWKEKKTTKAVFLNSKLDALGSWIAFINAYTLELTWGETHVS